MIDESGWLRHQSRNVFAIFGPFELKAHIFIPDVVETEDSGRKGDTPELGEKLGGWGLGETTGELIGHTAQQPTLRIVVGDVAPKLWLRDVASRQHHLPHGQGAVGMDQAQSKLVVIEFQKLRHRLEDRSAIGKAHVSLRKGQQGIVYRSGGGHDVQYRVRGHSSCDNDRIRESELDVHRLASTKPFAPDRELTDVNGARRLLWNGLGPLFTMRTKPQTMLEEQRVGDQIEMDVMQDWKDDGG